MSEKKADNLIVIKNLCFSYGSREVLKNINLNVEKGTILGIIGPNGGGKTTLLKIMLGLLKNYSGEVMSYCDKTGKAMEIHHKCNGYVPQHKNMNLSFPGTVYDIVEMGLYGMTGFWGPSAKEKEHVKQLLKEVGAYDLKDRPINALSGGQLQRVLIARALVGNPSILLLDEPLVGIDKTGVMNFLDLIVKIKNERGLTVVLVTHDYFALTATADKVACLNRTIHFHDNPNKLSQEDITRTFSCGYEVIETLAKGRPMLMMDDDR